MGDQFYALPNPLKRQKGYTAGYLTKTVSVGTWCKDKKSTCYSPLSTLLTFIPKSEMLCTHSINFFSQTASCNISSFILKAFLQRRMQITYELCYRLNNYLSHSLKMLAPTNRLTNWLNKESAKNKRML